MAASRPLRSVELFAGAGGLALGISRAGFQHCAVVERDAHACGSLMLNCGARVAGMAGWPVYRQDVREFNYGGIPADIDLLAAGVPCQPFSIAGKHLGPADERNMFPELVRAIVALRPKAILLENVRGLARPNFARYFCYIQLMVAYPELARRRNEEWRNHLARLERHHTSGRQDGLYYRVVFRGVNAADYGAPQRRERLLIVGVRGDLGMEWSFPQPTHSEAALLRDQFVSGKYWERHRVARRDRVPAPARFRGAGSPPLFDDDRLPWLTVRDAISDLPAPAAARAASEPDESHFQVPGARSYAGHTGSRLDRPAKTLKAGDHGVPGGENTLALPGGQVRYLTIRESARLQTFPDEYRFAGSWTESMRQIGNAVPVVLAAAMALRMRSQLTGLARG